MPPDPDRLRFFFDENTLGVGKAVTILRQDAIHVGHPLIARDVPFGTPDLRWMPWVAAQSLVVIGRDWRIARKPVELKAYRDHGLRCFWIAGKRELSSWDKLVRLVNRWAEIENTIASRGPGPWFMAVNGASLTEIALP